LTVAGIDTINIALERRFLLPFDAAVAPDRRAASRVVSPRVWRRACRALLAAHAPPGGLRTAVTARIDLLPHQLEPAIALVRADVLQAVLACQWDLLIVDEAHGAARDSDRRAAVSALARRAAYVVLVTATPHDGDERAFNALCGLGAHADRLLVFRRTRADVNLGTPRRVHQLRVRPNAAEIRLYA